ncbi:SRPBCC family protein [Kineococcus sp. LSe6-4]|uniref:SRPBCC family protein n=1 Tax=Kineococcus halophytocola TaxID=3234027 RepID=A0ABV4H5A3_9ACTN
MRLSVRGTRPAAAVWADYAQITRWPVWAPHLTSVEADADRIAVGVTGRVHGGPVPLPFRVTAVDEDAMTWTWRVLGIELVHAVRAVPGGCLTTFHGPAPYLPVAWFALRRLVSPRGSGRRQQAGDRGDG